MRIAQILFFLSLQQQQRQQEQRQQQQQAQSPRSSSHIDGNPNPTPARAIRENVSMAPAVPEAIAAPRKAIDEDDMTLEQFGKRRKLNLMCSIDDKIIKVMEIFSPPRVVPVAEARGMQECGSFDIRIKDPEDGSSWDLNCPIKRKKLWDIIIKEKPSLIIGSPECTPFSILHQMNPSQRNTPQYKAKLKEAINHLKFVCSIYK